MSYQGSLEDEIRTAAAEAARDAETAERFRAMVTQEEADARSAGATLPAGTDCGRNGCGLHPNHYGAHDDGTWTNDAPETTERLLERVRSALGNYQEAPSDAQAVACVSFLVDLVGTA